MANQVFANNMEVSCKAAAGKSICAFPDVCFTPPTTPATPPGVPIPYPNTGMASDTTSGSTSVKISGKEVMLKNKSYFQKSMGDEAGCAPKKGVVTSVNRGKVYFNAWSMDVKVEGENVVRMLDITTHNHASVPGNSPTWPYLDDEAAAGITEKCKEDQDKERAACGPLEVKHGTGRVKIEETQKNICADTEDAKKCREARRCMLTPYSPDRCCPGESPHHLVEAHGFYKAGERENKSHWNADFANYDDFKAPCVCASSPNSNWEAEHGDLHAVQGIKENYAIQTAGDRQPPRPEEFAWTYSESRAAGVDAHAATFPQSKCKGDCIAAQLDAYHQGMVGVTDTTPLRTEKYGFGTKNNQLGRGAQLIKQLAEKRIGDITGQPWSFG